MKRTLAILLAILMTLFLAASCGGGDDDDGGGNGDLSREGESCSKTADCEEGLRCVQQECVQDGDTTDGDTTPDGDTVDGDTADGDATDGDTTDGDTTTGDYNLTWVSIPGGSFEMGCSPNDDDCDSNEEPRHSVNVSGFKMTKYEVTNAQYAAFLNDRGNNNCSDYPCVDADSEYLRLSESGGDWSADGGYENHPLVKVTWYGAKAFCEAAGGRLPSEAEWEYAARAGTTTKYYCGDDSSCLDDIECWGKSDTCPAGQYDPNDFGLYDMLGGVMEWVEDCYHGDYTGAPTDGSVWDDEQCSSSRVLRGGSWFDNNVWYLRSSYRDDALPGTADGSSGGDGGFRCSRD